MATSVAIGEQAGPVRQATPPGERGMANPGPWAMTAFAGDLIEFTFGRKVLPFGPPPVK
jgi:hypothetical protein